MSELKLLCRLLSIFFYLNVENPFQTFVQTAVTCDVLALLVSCHVPTEISLSVQLGQLLFDAVQSSYDLFRYGIVESHSVASRGK